MADRQAPENAFENGGAGEVCPSGCGYWPHELSEAQAKDLRQDFPRACVPVNVQAPGAGKGAEGDKNTSPRNSGI